MTNANGYFPGLDMFQARTNLLNVGYQHAKPKNGHLVVLSHCFPINIHSREDVNGLLASQGSCVVLHDLPGHAATRFFDVNSSCSGEQPALGSDLIAPFNAMQVPCTSVNLPKDAPALLADAVLESACNGSCCWKIF